MIGRLSFLDSSYRSVGLKSSFMPVTIILRRSLCPATSRNRSSCCILSDTLLFIYITIIFRHNILERHRYEICGCLCRPGCHFVNQGRFRSSEPAEHITRDGTARLRPVDADADAFVFIRRQMLVQGFYAVMATA